MHTCHQPKRWITRVEGLGLLGFRVEGLGLLGFRVEGLGLIGFRVSILCNHFGP